jgi:hypothetical protein
MTSGLAITDVTLSGRRRSLPSPMFGHRDIWFDVTITVENTGKVPLHVVSALRSIAYDAESRLLTLRLREPKPLAGASEDAHSYVLPPPPTTTVPPHQSAQITVAIPAMLKQARQQPGAPLALDETDIRGMRTLRCEIAAGSRPAKWGRTITRDTAVTPDTRD